MPFVGIVTGPNISSGEEIKFSKLRRYFMKMNPRVSYGGLETFNAEEGSVSASDLLRSTVAENRSTPQYYNELDLKLPFVPDCTENIGIASDLNWKSSQFINSIKYQYIQQGISTDFNVEVENLSWNNNLDKTIVKKLFIDHTIASTDLNYSALSIGSTINNISFIVSGDILAAGGLPGASSVYKAFPGGDAVSFGGISDNLGGKNIYFDLVGNGRIFSGGGGGAAGGSGGPGGQGRQAFGSCNRPRVICAPFKKCKVRPYCEDCNGTPSPGGDGGPGGSGGTGRGYANDSFVGSSAPTNWTNKTKPRGTSAGCGALSGLGGQGGRGGRGGDGGDWGESAHDKHSSGGVYGHRGAPSSGCSQTPCGTRLGGDAPLYPLANTPIANGSTGSASGASIRASSNFHYHVYQKTNPDKFKGPEVTEYPKTFYVEPYHRIGYQIAPNKFAFYGDNRNGLSVNMRVVCSIKNVFTPYLYITSITDYDYQNGEFLAYLITFSQNTTGGQNTTGQTQFGNSLKFNFYPQTPILPE